MKREYYPYIAVAVLLLLLGAFIGGAVQSRLNPCKELPTAGVVVRVDTVRVPIPAPVSSGTVNKVTVKPSKRSDTAQIDEKQTDGTKEAPIAESPVNDLPSVLPSGEVEIPIERKTYQTEKYKAVVEGWRPSLVSMEVYEKTTTVTKIKKPFVALSVGPGFNWDGKEVKPGVNVTLGFIILSK